jgi:hypothetical protein
MRMQNANGATTGRSTAENTTLREMESSIRALAERTGGTAIINTNDIGGYLRGMMATTSAYYLLGYTPTNTALDGKFRRITVKVDRPGVLVHARPGYTAGRPPEIRPAERPGTAAPSSLDAAFSALAASSAGSGFHVSAFVWTRRDAAGQPAGALWIAGEFDPTARPTGAAATNGVAQITIQPATGGRGVSRSIDIPSGATAFSIDVTSETLQPGDYSVRVAVTRPDAAALSDVKRVTLPDTPTPLGDAIVYRRGPATAQRYVRTAVARFQRNERLRIEVPTHVAGPAAAVLRDSKGGILQVPVTVTERADDSGAWKWIVADVAMAPLAPAVYAVEITQDGVSRVAAFRLVP